MPDPSRPETSFEEYTRPQWVALSFSPEQSADTAAGAVDDRLQGDGGRHDAAGAARVVAEGIPVHDSVAFTAYARQKGTRIIGPNCPNCPGLIAPGQSNAGIIPADITEPGRIGPVSKPARSPTSSCTS